jgi:hypothetical protein
MDIGARSEGDGRAVYGRERRASDSCNLPSAVIAVPVRASTFSRREDPHDYIDRLDFFAIAANLIFLISSARLRKKRSRRLPASLH